MVRFSWKRASGLTGARQSFARKTGIRTTRGGGGSAGGIISVIIVMVVIFWLISLFCSCDQSDDLVVSNQLEEQLEHVLKGNDPKFDHIDIEEYSDAAVIRGKIVSLNLSNTLRGIGEREEPQSVLDLELEYLEAQLDATLHDEEFNWTEEEWIQNRMNEIEATREAREREMEPEVREIRVLITQLRAK